MRVSRETVSIALFELLQLATIGEPPVSAWQTTSRKPKIWSDVAVGDQPFMSSFPGDEDDAQDQAYGAENYLLNFTVLIYARADANPDVTGETLLNQLVDSVDDVLQSFVLQGRLIKIIGQPQTLGGLVTNCWIEGRMVKDIGILDQQMKEAIPLKVRTGM